MATNWKLVLRSAACRWTALAVAVVVGALLATRPSAQESPATVQPYALRHVTSEEAAEKLRKLLADLEGDTRVFADARSNRVLVQGNAKAQRLAASMLQTLDQPGTPEAAEPSREVKGYRVAGDLATAVQRLERRFPQESGVKIAADDRTRQVIVIAPAEVQRAVAQYLQLAPEGNDAPRTAPVAATPPANRQGPPPSAPPLTPTVAPLATAADNEPYTLRHVSSKELESELARLWGDQLLIARASNSDSASVSLAGANGAQPLLQIDRQTNEVTFLGNDRTTAQWRSVVEAIDSRQDDSNQATALIPVRKSNAGVIQTTVSLLNDMAQKSAEEEEVTQSVPAAAGQRRTSADLVRLIYQQQTGEQQPGAPNPAAPDNAEPNPALPATDPGDGGGPLGPVQVEIIGNTIILRGKKSDVARVRKIIEDIERLVAEAKPYVEVYQMQHINGEAAATLVRELHTEALAERLGTISIRALGDPNAILLVGREEGVKEIIELIKKLDQPSPPASQFEIFSLKHISSVDAEATVRNFFVDQPGTNTNPRAGIGIRVKTIADFRTNTLIVQASPRDMTEVRRLIESIDVEDSPSKAQLRVFKLKNTTAETLATVLQAAITGQAATGAQGQQQQQQQQQGGSATSGQARQPSNQVEILQVGPGGVATTIQSGILNNVQVTADTNTNSLIIRAPAKSMDLIAALIEQLDRLPDAAATVKVFEIVNGNATSLVTMLQQLFGLTSTTGAAGGQNLLGGAFGANLQLPGTTAGGDSALVPLRFAVDQRTNSIIASGSEADLQVVGDILYRLDGNVDDRRLNVVRLRNTQAASVATAVQSYLQNLQQQVQTQLQSQQVISASESVERLVFVVPEAVTNSLIVSASPRYQEEIHRVIQELDVRPPMVMVQVLIAEVTLGNQFEFGTELGLQDSLVFDRGKAVNSPPLSPSDPGFNFNNLNGVSPRPGYPNVNSYQQETLAGQSLSSFALGRASQTLGYGGLVLSAANESVSILLRALQDENRLQILSRPQVMTMHNQPAYVTVGANIARPGATTISQGVSTQGVEYEDTGLILSILPLINDDGVIVMGIEAERSALGSDAEGTQISSGVAGSAPITIKPLNVTRASTTISAHDGQTVAFAGLITKTNQLNLRRVPYLSDIPVLGNLFKFESNLERRTELLIIMTPHIVRDEAQAELLKIQESERMSWCLADVVNVAGDLGLRGGNGSFGEAESPLIYPDLDPTGGAPTPAADPAAAPQPTPAPPTPPMGSALRSPPPATMPPPGAIGPTMPPLDAAARNRAAPYGLPTNPTQVTYGPPPGPIAPANFQPGTAPQRLPGTRE